jgi:hypothetical protein
MKVSNEEIKQYFEDVEAHDWFYAFSDDQRVWNKGSESERNLINVSETNETFGRIWKDWLEFKNSRINKTEAKEPVLENYLIKTVKSKKAE